MNLKEITTAAQAYCDRYDEELVTSMPSFLKVVEGKINNALRTGDQSIRAQIYLERDNEYYGLPATGAVPVTLRYCIRVSSTDAP